MTTKLETKLVFPAERPMPKPRQMRPNKQLRPPTASPASPDWWLKSCLRHSTSQVSERLVPVNQRGLVRTLSARSVLSVFISTWSPVDLPTICSGLHLLW